MTNSYLILKFLIMKTYIAPKTLVTNITLRSTLLQNMSVVGDKDITVNSGGTNVGLVKEDNSSRGGGYNVWDDDWNK